jgi:hypothetical protein
MSSFVGMQNTIVHVRLDYETYDRVMQPLDDYTMSKPVLFVYLIFDSSGVVRFRFDPVEDGVFRSLIG